MSPEHMNNLEPYIPPVLFCIFNRLDYTKKTFEKIRKAKPKLLFIAADGPRKNFKNDAISCQNTREWVVNNVDWDCKVELLFSGRNMGCSQAMPSAISWFFSNVEEGVILEDDCVVADCFFEFCGMMLQKYRHNDNVMVVTGFGVLDQASKRGTDYVFCKGIFNEFAIATWRRAWQKNNAHLGKWPQFKENGIRNFHRDTRIVNNIYNYIEKNYYHYGFCWGHNFIQNVIMNSGLYISPVGNLVNNIGLLNGVHSPEESLPLLHKKTIELDLQNLRHPNKIEIDEDLLALRCQNQISIPSISVGRKTLHRLKKSRKIKMLRYLLLPIIAWELIKTIFKYCL